MPVYVRGLPDGNHIVFEIHVPEKTGPTSTAAGAAILNAVVSEAVAGFIKRGITPPVFSPWMLPGVWAVRPFYKVLFEAKSLKRKKQHLAALSEENLNLRQEMLNLVGLDYHF